MATNGAAALYDRLSDALGAHDVHPDDRATVQGAYLEAGGEDATWDDLPADVQELVQRIEKTPRTSWDDPSEVPGATPLED